MLGSFFLLQMGCEPNKIDTDIIDSGVVEETDIDMDGYYSNEDCDDGNANIYPNAQEICDGIDNNCNNEIDEDLRNTYYLDADEDGFGDENEPIEACNVPAGYSLIATDCNDDDATVYPSSEEQCDEIDNNCNDIIDEDVTDFWYIDLDRDGFGTEEDFFEGCDPGEGYVVNATDCDDTMPNINPGAPELCDGIDNDCNGTIDDDIGGIWYRDSDNDGVGDSNVITYSCGQPNGYVGIQGDCNDLDGEVYPGAIEYCDYIDNDCDGVFDEEDAFNQPTWYLDSDNDTFGNITVTIQACAKPVGYVQDGTDCDDSNSTVYINAPELCDGIINNCGYPLPENEQDADEDGFVVCEIDIGGWQGEVTVIGGNDCDDEDGELAPAIIEICDGRSNQCGQNTPENEIDDDGDGYVECNASLQTWLGDTIEGGNDCDDSNDSIYPTALELCDGIVNNCGNPLPDTEQDVDGDNYVECSFDTGGWKGASNIVGDEDCDDTDQTVYPSAMELCDGIVNDCGNSLPENEQDVDGDKYVACIFDENGWDGALNIVGDDDCDDDVPTVYPSALEICDGRVNACGNPLPYDEIDNDGDGYVECNASLQNWFGDDIQGGGDCDDDESTIIPNGVEICDGIANSCVSSNQSNPVPAYEIDNDGDGYIECEPIADWQGSPLVIGGGDCNDVEGVGFSIHPSATEICDGIDNDCSEGIDNGVKDTFYFDADGDGYGNPNSTTQNCNQPNNYVTNSNDCNDSNFLAYTGALEVCDGSDNDCDNQIDEGVSTTYYADNDQDGYGSPNSTIQACNQPNNYVTNSNDCNDSNFLAYTGASEVCDGSDNDCDNQIDEGVQTLYFSDSDGDGYGNGESSAYACSPPPNHVSNSNDCNDGIATVHPNSPEVCDSLDNNCNNSVDEGVQNTYYADSDGDTLGNPNVIQKACSLPLGYSTNNNDCNDGNAQATTIGSDASCARSSCLELLNENSNLQSGTYWIQPNSSSAFATFCDMDTDGGGWTQVSWNQARYNLDGYITVLDSASTYQETDNGPKTRDGSDSHYYRYAFKFNSGFSEFMFEDYVIKANAGNGHTSDLNSGTFTFSNWEQGYSGSKGDVGWGGSTAPILSLASLVGTNNCKDCTYDLPNFTIYDTGSSQNRFLIGWGEKGSQNEGWYPWYSGYVYVR